MATSGTFVTEEPRTGATLLSVRTYNHYSVCRQSRVAWHLSGEQDPLPLSGYRRSRLKAGDELSELIQNSAMSRADKRIPVTEERWTELNELKKAGQTYDDLLEELIQEHQRRQLAERTRNVREADSEELTPLDDV
mgnify:CR=1 FL=1